MRDCKYSTIYHILSILFSNHVDTPSVVSEGAPTLYHILYSDLNTMGLVSHNILLSHLEHCIGILDIVLTWFKSYLSDQSQCVTINGVQSPLEALSSGIPRVLCKVHLVHNLHTTHGDIIYLFYLFEFEANINNFLQKLLQVEV